MTAIQTVIATLIAERDKLAAQVDGLNRAIAALDASTTKESPAPAPGKRPIKKRVSVDIALLKAMHEAGKSDGQIATAIGCTPGAVCAVRRQLGLPALYRFANGGLFQKNGHAVEG